VISLSSSKKDYEEVGSLLVDTFDEPRRRRSNSSVNSDGDSEKGFFFADELMWKLLVRPVMERQLTSRYEGLARRMRGRKYALLLAKRWKEDGRGREVVGMAELGMYPTPPLWQNELESSGANEAEGVIVKEIGEGDVKPMPTVGLIAVSPSARGVGLGRALVQICEEIASSHSWGVKSHMLAAVEPDNHGAMQLFVSSGYTPITTMERMVQTEVGTVPMVTVQVREGMRTVSYPHVLLRKELSSVGVTNADTLN